MITVRSEDDPKGRKTMKLLLAVISKDDVDETLKNLCEHKVDAAQIASSGSGFLVPGNATIVALVPDDQADRTIELIRETAGTVRRHGNDSYNPTSIFSGVEEGGGFVAVLDGDKLVRL